jgi:hypothetical protein
MKHAWGIEMRERSKHVIGVAMVAIMFTGFTLATVLR